MAKGFNYQPRWRNLLLARAILFAISVVLSSSGEDIEPHVRGFGGIRGDGGATAEPLHEQRELEWAKAGKAKSAKSSKSKSAKAKSAKWSKSKSAKSKSSKIGKAEKGAKSESRSGSKSAKVGHSGSSGSDDSPLVEGERTFRTIPSDDVEQSTVNPEDESIRMPPEGEQPVVGETQLSKGHVSNTDPEQVDAGYVSSTSGDASVEEPAINVDDIGGATQVEINGDGGDVVSSEELESVTEPSNFEDEFDVERMEESEEIAMPMSVESEYFRSGSGDSSPDHNLEETVDDSEVLNGSMESVE